MTLRPVDTLAVTGRRVFLRVDFNVPYGEGGGILDDSRIQEALPTIRHLQKSGARLIIASHLGRPKGRDLRLSLLPVGEHLSSLLKQDVIFPEDCVGDAVRKLIHNLKEGELLLLENLRFHPEEEANDPSFSQKLASMVDVYVSDAFGALHRSHASTVGMVAHLKEKGIGLLIQKELAALTRLLENPSRPFYAVLGGAKVSDKIGVIENLLDRANGLLFGGALAYTFLKARGESIGGSKFEEEKLRVAQRILDRAQEKQVAVLLPVDHKVVPQIEQANRCRVVTQIPEHETGVDIGPETVRLYREMLAKAGTIFWNGPMGIFENPVYSQGTFEIAKAVAGPGITSVIGGGESVTACKQAGVAENVTHLSTGGGATLEFLEGKELPGLKALEI